MILLDSDDDADPLEFSMSRFDSRAKDGNEAVMIHDFWLTLRFP